GEIVHPKTGARMSPTPLELDSMARWQARSNSDYSDRREALAAWLTSRGNFQFARTVVNRYWAALIGRGLVNPSDDMRITNPPSNPELLDALARDFIDHGCDLKRTLRIIATSHVYQLSSISTPQNRQDEVFYSHHLPRRMPAEAMLDAICAATGAGEKFAGVPAGTRAIQLPDTTVASQFLDTFGRPPRTTSCECERAAEPSLTQALSMLSGDDLSKKIAAADGRLAKLVGSGKSDREIIDEIYLSSVSRHPDSGEISVSLRAFGKNS